MILVKCSFFGGKIYLPPFLTDALHTVPLHIDITVFISFGFFYDKLCGMAAKITGQNYTKCNRLIGFHCPENAFVIF